MDDVDLKTIRTQITVLIAEVGNRYLINSVAPAPAIC